MSAAVVTANEIVELLGGWRYAFAEEVSLQDGIAMVLQGAGVAFEREVALSPVDRPDFVVGRVVVEIKIRGSAADVLRQMHRYAQHDAIAELVLVTSRVFHRLPESLNGKPVRVLRVGGAW